MLDSSSASDSPACDLHGEVRLDYASESDGDEGGVTLHAIAHELGGASRKEWIAQWVNASNPLLPQTQALVTHAR